MLVDRREEGRNRHIPVDAADVDLIGGSRQALGGRASGEPDHAADRLPGPSAQHQRVEQEGVAAEAAEAAARLASYSKPTAVTFWHEPHGDMTPSQYVAASKQILPQFKVGGLRVGRDVAHFVDDQRRVRCRRVLVVEPDRGVARRPVFVSIAGPGGLTQPEKTPA